MGSWNAEQKVYFYCKNGRNVEAHKKLQYLYISFYTLYISFIENNYNKIYDLMNKSIQPNVVRANNKLYINFPINILTLTFCCFLIYFGHWEEIVWWGFSSLSKMFVNLEIFFYGNWYVLCSLKADERFMRARQILSLDQSQF